MCLKAIPGTALLLSKIEIYRDNCKKQILYLRHTYLKMYAENLFVLLIHTMLLDPGVITLDLGYAP